MPSKPDNTFFLKFVMVCFQKTTNAPKANGSLKNVPFSMCEERRLMRGVMQFGYSWKTILNSYKFANVRTADDLRNKWRSMNK